MSVDAMKQALEALELWCPASGHALNKRAEAVVALRAAIEQVQGLAEKVPAKGTLLEQTLRKVWDEMPHTALMDAIIGGTGVMLGDKRIDPASIYKQPEQEPVAWMYHGIRHDDTPHERPSLIWKPEYMDVMSAEKGAKATPLYTAPRQWQGLTEEDREEILRWVEWKEIGSDQSVAPQKLIAYVEKKLREKNNG